MKLWCDTGDVINPKPSLRGCVHYLNCEDVQHLLCLVQQNSDCFLNELLHMLKNHFIPVHYVTIYQEFKCACISTKKIKRIAQKGDGPHQADFVEQMAQYAPEELGFL